MKNLYYWLLFFLLILSSTEVALAKDMKALNSADPELTKELIERRGRVFDLMDSNSLLILFPSKQKNRSNDVFWPYRQTNDLYYLTGINTPDTFLVMIKDGSDNHSVLFAKKPTPEYEQWQGKLPSIEQLKADTGIKTAYSHTKFRSFVNSLLNGYKFGVEKRTGEYNRPEFYSFYEKIIKGDVKLWLALGENRRYLKEKYTDEITFSNKVRNKFPEIKILNITPALQKLREIKSTFEIKQLTKAIDITVDAQKKAMHYVQTAQFEYQIQALTDFTFRNNGACCWAFPAITASGANATVLHYEHPNSKIEREKLFLTDIGAEVEFYAADVTRTYPADGTFSDEQKDIYSAVLRAQDQAIKKARVGASINDIEKSIILSLTDSLLELGLITENDIQQVFVYYAHGFGHSLGMDVHDTFIYHQTLRKNMVITIEPGLYIRKSNVKSSEFYKKLNEEQKTALDKNLDKYDGIGVRIEDDILITKRGPKNLSAGAPRTIEEIERWMAAPQQFNF